MNPDNHPFTREVLSAQRLMGVSAGSSDSSSYLRGNPTVPYCRWREREVTAFSV